MSDEDSLKGAVNDFGDIELKNAIHDRYSHLLTNEVLFGEPLDVKEVKTAMRRYDYGEASKQKVREVGVRVRFDPDKTDLEDVQEGGRIYADIHRLAEQHFTCGVKGVDLSFVTEDEYELWVLADIERLIE